MLNLPKHTRSSIYFKCHYNRATQFINQYPYESCLVYKNNLAKTVRAAYGYTDHIQMTYILDDELNAFVGEFVERMRKGEENFWILKPHNLARSMDTVVTDNLGMIIRYMETGPKIAQKYIERPLLYKGRKVDLRFIILLKKVTNTTSYSLAYSSRSLCLPHFLDKDGKS